MISKTASNLIGDFKQACILYGLVPKLSRYKRIEKLPDKEVM